MLKSVVKKIGLVFGAIVVFYLIMFIQNDVHDARMRQEMKIGCLTGTQARCIQWDISEEALRSEMRQLGIDEDDLKKRIERDQKDNQQNLKSLASEKHPLHDQYESEKEFIEKKMNYQNHILELLSK